MNSLISRAFAVATASATLLTGSAQLSSASTTFTDLDDFHTNPAFARYYEQKPAWGAQPCPTGTAPEVECARLESPRNWHDASKGALTITVSRAKGASAQGKRLLLGAPGGPGNSGLGMAASLTKNFDLADTHYGIGLDPRGMGSSSPVTCSEPVAQERDLSALGDDRRYTLELVRASIRNAATNIQRCITQENAQSINTEETARDYALITRVLGYQKADLVGGSYGSLLGSVVARMFPLMFERVVLEANMNWYDANYDDETPDGMQSKQYVWDRLVLPFVARHHDHYGLGKTPAEVDRTLERIRANTKEWPGMPPLFNSHELSIEGALSGPETLSRALEGFRELARDLDRVAPAVASPSQTSTAQPPPFTRPVSIETLICGDYVGARDSEAKFRSLEGLARALPLGLRHAFVSACPGFTPEKPALTPEILHRPVRSMMMTSAEGDGTTGYRGMRRTLAKLDRSRVKAVVVDNGFGHVRVGSLTPCALTPLRQYLRSGELPTGDVTCQASPLRLEITDNEGNVVGAVVDDLVYEFGDAGSGSRLPEPKAYVTRDLSPQVPAAVQPGPVPARVSMARDDWAAPKTPSSERRGR